VVTQAFPAADGAEPVVADVEEAAGVEELVFPGDGDEPEVAGGADWHPVSKADTTTARARAAFITPRP
jgi:hypothetical protein